MHEMGVDLHIHSALSPCAEDEMTPPRVLKKAREMGIELLAITDHNSAENVQAFVEAAPAYGVTVLPGIEVQTREEVHMLCLFDHVEQALKLQEEVYANLPDLPNREDFFGLQFLVDVDGKIIGQNKRLLLTSTDLSIEKVVKSVRSYGGLVIPAHLDKKSFSLWAQLGFIPTDLALLAVELTRWADISQGHKVLQEGAEYPVVISSDAHRLEELKAPRTYMHIEEPTIEEIRQALLHNMGREILYRARTHA